MILKIKDFFGTRDLAAFRRALSAMVFNGGGQCPTGHKSEAKPQIGLSRRLAAHQSPGRFEFLTITDALNIDAIIQAPYPRQTESLIFSRNI